ncbi:TonB-dependent receptor [Sinomicrobium soli]|uniref:TonB-dependent receptor n=1 Tax=Sinomicrobium sp. N-1-3-6 TaxID=2219864 RepID=UPI0013752E8C|nr:TonB-dependent receptor [Sinomicrobium sp. N-1-3-6]
MFCCILMSYTVTAQEKLDREIQLPAASLTIGGLMSEIERQGDLRFVYSSRHVDTEKNIHLSSAINSIKHILEETSLQSGLRFSLSGDQLVVNPMGKGAVTGYIKDTGGVTLDMVNIIVRGTTMGTFTDTAGKFTIRNIPEGHRILRISLTGHATLEIPVNIIPGEVTQTGEITLEESVEQLKEVTIEGDRVNPYADKKTEYVARMPLNNLENPQVYHVITGDLLKEQLEISVRDALNNAPGVVTTAYPAGGFGITLRGFNSDINARNGMQTSISRSSVDLTNIERIEVLKGPSSTLFQGQSSYGGVVNIVTKKPHRETSGSIGYSFGSFGLSRATVDYNTPVNEEKTLLFRVNSSLHRIGSFKEAGHNNTFSIAPSFIYNVNDDLSISGDIEIFNFDETRTGSYTPGPYKNTADIPLNREPFGADDVNAEGTNINTYLQAKYTISPHWKSTTNISVTNVNLKSSLQPHFHFISADTIVREGRLYGPIVERHLQLQQNFNGEFAVAGMKNQLLAGVDYRKYKYTRNDLGRGLMIDTISIHDPYQVLTRRKIEKEYIKQDKETGSSYSENARYGLYVSNVLHLTDKMALMLSLRADRYESEGDDSWGQTAVSPKLGFVYQPVKDQISVFGNYMDGFSNRNTATREDGTLENLDPEHATQYEGGVKMELFDQKISATISYYLIKIHNATISDDQGWYIAQDGVQESKGFDIELIANPLPGLNVLAGYARNENQYLKATRYEGKYVTGMPQNVGNFWVSYRFQPGSVIENFGIGAGGNFVDHSFYDGDNIVTNPSYALFNGSIFYDRSRWRAGLKVNNITDRTYFNTRGMLENPLNVVANLMFRF